MLVWRRTGWWTRIAMRVQHDLSNKACWISLCLLVFNAGDYYATYACAFCGVDTVVHNYISSPHKCLLAVDWLLDVCFLGAYGHLALAQVWASGSKISQSNTDKKRSTKPANVQCVAKKFTANSIMNYIYTSSSIVRTFARKWADSRKGWVEDLQFVV